MKKLKKYHIVFKIYIKKYHIVFKIRDMKKLKKYHINLCFIRKQKIFERRQRYLRLQILKSFAETLV